MGLSIGLMTRKDEQAWAQFSSNVPTSYVVKSNPRFLAEAILQSISVKTFFKATFWILFWRKEKYRSSEDDDDNDDDDDDDDDVSRDGSALCLDPKAQV